MSIRFSTQSIDFELHNEDLLKKWITEVVKRSGKTVGNINYLFCDDSYLIEVNRRYLNHDTYTDIITFDYVAANLVSGDIMISVDRVKENAGLFGVAFEFELYRVIIHGVLHLLGQGDKTPQEEKEMRHLEELMLKMLEDMFHVEQCI